MRCFKQHSFVLSWPFKWLASFRRPIRRMRWLVCSTYATLLLWYEILHECILFHPCFLTTPLTFKRTIPDVFPKPEKLLASVHTRMDSYPITSLQSFADIPKVTSKYNAITLEIINKMSFLCNATTPIHFTALYQAILLSLHEYTDASTAMKKIIPQTQKDHRSCTSRLDNLTKLLKKNLLMDFGAESV